jgi:uncharacterized protein (TIGR01244 family)
MKITQLSRRFSVTGQITADDLRAIAKHGFDHIINNRPDDEAAAQPRSDELANAAENLGIEYAHLPVASGRISKENIADFNGISRILGNRVLLFCRSGERSTKLWQLSAYS